MTETENTQHINLQIIAFVRVNFQYFLRFFSLLSRETFVRYSIGYGLWILSDNDCLI